MFWGAVRSSACHMSWLHWLSTSALPIAYWDAWFSQTSDQIKFALLDGRDCVLRMFRITPTPYVKPRAECKIDVQERWNSMKETQTAASCTWMGWGSFVLLFTSHFLSQAPRSTRAVW